MHFVHVLIGYVNLGGNHCALRMNNRAHNGLYPKRSKRAFPKVQTYNPLNHHQNVSVSVSVSQSVSVSVPESMSVSEGVSHIDRKPL